MKICTIKRDINRKLFHKFDLGKKLTVFLGLACKAEATDTSELNPLQDTFACIMRNI